MKGLYPFLPHSHTSMSTPITSIIEVDQEDHSLDQVITELPTNITIFSDNPPNI